MRTFLKILGGLVLFGGIAAGIALWLTSGIADTGNNFISKLRSGDNKAAYEQTSAGFRKSTDFKSFEAFVSRWGIKGAEEPSWSSRNIKGAGDSAIGTLSGSIKDAKGNSTPLRLTLTKNGGNWTVHHMRLSRGGVATNQGDVPPENDLIKLVHANNLAFTKSVEAKDFTEFYGLISELWRKQASQEKIARIFEGFTKRNAKFGGFGKLTPAFDGPAKILSNGSMRVTGSYETRPLRITYKHTYLKEGLSWKLVGFGFQMKPPAKTGPNKSSKQ